MNADGVRSKATKARRHEDTAYLPLTPRWNGERPGAVISHGARVTSLVTGRGIAVAVAGQDQLPAQACATRAKPSLVRQIADLIEDAVALRRGHPVFRLPVTGADGRVFGILAVCDLQPFGGSRNDNGMRVDRVEAALVVVCTAWSRKLGVLA